MHEISSNQTRIDNICDRFEAAWKQAASPADRPRLESFLNDVSQTDHSALLRELVVLDVVYRRQFGESPVLSDYTEPYPQLDAAWVAENLGDSLGHQLSTVDHDFVAKSSGQAAETVVDQQPVKKFGKFELLERIGAGAFGAVWRAKDTTLDRIVALKIPHSGSGIDPDEMARFQREARASAQLRHPGIVTVFEVVVHDNVPTIVADFVAGVTLKDFLKLRPLTNDEAARFISQAAEAIDYAHRMGVVHRDLKPANIMIGLAPEIPKNKQTPLGKPLVMDFGLASRAGKDVTVTREGMILGTPAYMSPEQAAGMAHLADARSDVYSLGVMLYQLLCGELPFRGSDVMSILQKVIRDEPRNPRSLDKSIPRDLATVCLKAMAKEPERRYQTAGALARDLERYLDGEPVEARPLGLLGRGVRWARRRPTVAGLLVLGLAAIGLVAVSIMLFQAMELAQIGERNAIINERNKEVLRREAQKAREKAEALRNEIAEQNYRSEIRLAHRAWDDKNVAFMRDRLQLCDAKYRHWEWNYLKRLCESAAITIRGSRESFSSVAFSPDGKVIASGDRESIKLWDAQTGKLRRALSHSAVTVLFSPDGRYLASGSNDRGVRLWDVRTGKILHTMREHRGYPAMLAFSSDSRILASGWNHMRIQDVQPGRVVCRVSDHRRLVMALAFSRDNQFLWSGDDDGVVRLWNAKTGKEVKPQAFSGAPPKFRFDKDGRKILVGCIAIDSQGRHFARGYRDGSIKIHDGQTGKVVQSLSGHKKSVSVLAFCPNGRFLASAGRPRIGDSAIKVWDVQTGRLRNSFQGYTQGITGLAFSADSKRLASCGHDNTIRIWNLYDQHAQRAADRYCIKVAISRDGKLVAGSAINGVIHILDTRSGKVIRSLEKHGGLIVCLAISPDRRTLIGGSSDKTVHFWRIQTGKLLGKIRGFFEHIHDVAFSPDGSRIAIATGTRTAEIWEVGAMKKLSSFIDDPGAVFSVAFTADGKFLVTGNSNKAIVFWDILTRKKAYSLRVPHDQIKSVAISADGRYAAAGCEGAKIVVWNLHKKQIVHTLDGHANAISDLTFSSDGKRIFSCDNSSIKIWETKFGKEVLTIIRGEFRTLALSADDRFLIGAGINGTIIWYGAPWHD